MRHVIIFPMKKLTIGILAHVDAGKTTLTEALLYESGVIRKLGRVDSGDAYLDTESLEKSRGITIVSKQAVIERGDSRITLIDTPGHLDFSAETERAIEVLDLAIFLISAPDGVTENGRTYFSLLEKYNVPVLVFVNKMDQTDKSHEDIMAELQTLGHGFVNISNNKDSVIEDMASCSEKQMERYLNGEDLELDDFQADVASRNIMPVTFGSALHLDGIEELLSAIDTFASPRNERDEFGAKVFKINRDADGTRLCFIKLTGGKLSVRDQIGEEKVSQIRLYSGGKYTAIPFAESGDVVALTGLNQTFAGQGLGCEVDSQEKELKPVLRFRVNLPKEVSERTFLPKLKELEEEDPLLQVDWNEKKQTIEISVMGELQLEILKAQIMDRYQVEVSFDDGDIIYKETIKDSTYGFGHFEPLRHYAEVQLLIEPLPQGSGIEIATNISASELKLNYQKAVFATLTQCLPRGILTGSAITDLKITLTAGKASVKHSNPHDFREATRRAIRAGLMKVENVLLEPFFSYVAEVPEDATGRVMHDLSSLGGTCEVTEKNMNLSKIEGHAPAARIRNYEMQLRTLTGGNGHISMKYEGYFPCHNAEQVIEHMAYDPDADMKNPSSSVFVDHGTGVSVPWYEAEVLMQTDSREHLYFDVDTPEKDTKFVLPKTGHEKRDLAIGVDEIDDIIRKNSYSNSRSDKWKFRRENRHDRYNNNISPVASEADASSDKVKVRAMQPKKKLALKKKYLLVDGYNIIHAWTSLKELTEDYMEGARFKLLDILSNYQALWGGEIIVVFDAYRVRGHHTSKMDYQNIHMVFTKEAETADQYIAKFTLENTKNMDITIATSDGMVQLIIRGAGAKVISARELEIDVDAANHELMEAYKRGAFD